VTGYVAPYYADRVFWNRRSDTPIHGGSPQGWVSIGGPPAPVTIVSSPAVASWAPNRQDVFVVGSDGNMWHTATFTGDWSDHVGWSSWSHPTTEGFNGFAGDPDLASWGDQRLDLLVFDRQNPPKLWHAYWDHGAGFQQWFTWPTPSGKTLTPSPSIVGMGYGRLEVSVRENNGAIWHELYDDFDGFAPWQWAGGYAVGGSDLSVPW
jgi:hypothetical protein